MGDYLPLIVFSYSNKYHASIGMALFEAFYGRRCRTPIWWFNFRESSILGPKMIYEASEMFTLIRDKLATTYSW